MEENQTPKPRQLSFIQSLQQGYTQNYSAITQQQYNQICQFLQNFCDLLIKELDNELQKGKVNLDDTQFILIQEIQNQFKQLNIDIEDYKIEYLQGLQSFINNFLEIFQVLIKFLISEDFFNLLDEIEILHNEINVFLLQNKLMDYFLYDYLKLIKPKINNKNQQQQQFDNFQQFIGLFLNIDQFRFTFDQIITNLVKNYQQNRRIVLEEVHNFQKNTAQTQINNKYIIIGYLRELSDKLYSKIKQSLLQSQILFNDEKLIYQYSKFIIEQHEQYDLINNKIHPIEEFGIENDSEDDIDLLVKDTNNEDIRNSIKQQKQIQNSQSIGFLDLSEIDKKLQLITDDTSKCYMQSIVRDDGVKGLLATVTQNQNINNQEQEEEQKKEDKVQQQEKSYLLRINLKNQLILVNGLFIGTRWMIVKENQTEVKQQFLWGYNKNKNNNNSNLETQTTNTIQNILQPQKPSPDFMINQQHISSYQKYQMGAVCNIGLSLGYCLANINSYPNTQEFLKDFGQTAALNGSITYMIVAVPILGPLLVLGGLGFMSLQLFQNDTANSKSKLKQTGKIALQTGTGIGGTVGGAVLGQALIPIPVLGALVGGVLGGFLSATASSKIIKLIDKDKVKKVVIKLEQLQIVNNNQGYWQYSDQIQEIYGIKSKFFYNSMPEVFWPTPDVWLSIVTYYFISFYYGQQEQKIHEEKMKQWEKTKKKQLKEFIKQNQNQEDLINQFKEDLDQKEKKLMQEEDANVWPPTIQYAQNYIIDQQIDTLQFYQKIEEFVIKVLKDV